MKMFEIRKIKKDKWLIILLVGLLLVVIAMPVSDIKSDQTQDEQQVQKAENASEDTYADALETRLENALAKVEGVGNVKVMITLASSSEKVVEKDQEMTSEVQENTQLFCAISHSLVFRLQVPVMDFPAQVHLF